MILRTESESGGLISCSSFYRLLFLYSLDVYDIPGTQCENWAKDRGSHQNGIVDHNKLGIVSEFPLGITHKTCQNQEGENSQCNCNKPQIVSEHGACKRMEMVVVKTLINLADNLTLLPIRHLTQPNMVVVYLINCHSFKQLT